MGRLKVIFTGLFSVLAFLTVYGQEVLTSPNKAYHIEYKFLEDDPTGVNYSHILKVFRADNQVFLFKARGRAIESAWSPDSRYILFGVTLEGRDMALYYVDLSEKKPREHNLELDTIESKVESSLPERKSGSFAGRSRIDFDAIAWEAPNRCRLRYVYCFDRKGGDAALLLDFKTKPVRLKIEKIVPFKEED